MKSLSVRQLARKKYLASLQVLKDGAIQLAEREQTNAAMELGNDWIESVLKFKKALDQGEAQAKEVDLAGLKLKDDMIAIYQAGPANTAKLAFINKGMNKICQKMDQEINQLICQDLLKSKDLATAHKYVCKSDKVTLSIQLVNLAKQSLSPHETQLFQFRHLLM